MIRTSEVKVGDYSYSVAQLPAMDALKLLHRFAKAAGPAIAKMGGALDGAAGIRIGDRTVDVGALAGGLEQALGSFTGDDLEHVTRTLLRGSRITEAHGEAPLPEDPDISKPRAFDAHFTGRIEDVFALLREALRVNYGDFFAKLLAAVPRRASAPPTPAPQ